MKILKKIVFFFIAISLFSSKTFSKPPEITRYPNDYLYTVHQDPWKFFEQIFIIEPEGELGSKKINFQRFIGGILELSPGVAWFFYKAFPGIKQYSHDIFKNGYRAIFTSISKSFVLHSIISIVTMVILFIYFDRMIISSHKNAILFEKFRNLIITSPNNQKLIPLEHQELIQHIYNKYTETARDADLKKYAKEVIPTITQQIYEQFPIKYRDKLETKKRLDSWIKWSVIALVGAATLKLLTSAAKDGFEISEQLKNVHLFQENKDDLAQEEPTNHNQHNNENNNENRDDENRDKDIDDAIRKFT